MTKTDLSTGNVLIFHQLNPFLPSKLLVKWHYLRVRNNVFSVLLPSPRPAFSGFFFLQDDLCLRCFFGHIFWFIQLCGTLTLTGTYSLTSLYWYLLLCGIPSNCVISKSPCDVRRISTFIQPIGLQPLSSNNVKVCETVISKPCVQLGAYHRYPVI